MGMRPGVRVGWVAAILVVMALYILFRVWGFGYMNAMLNHHTSQPVQGPSTSRPMR